MDKNIQTYSRNGEFEKTLKEIQFELPVDDEYFSHSSEISSETGSGSELDEEEDIVEYDLIFHFIYYVTFSTLGLPKLE